MFIEATGSKRTCPRSLRKISTRLFPAKRRYSSFPKSIYRKSSIKPPPLSNKPLPFQRRKVNKHPLSIKPPLPLPSTLIQSQTINIYLSVMVYSGWKFILFLVFGRMTSNFMCLTFSTLSSSSLWRIVTILLLLGKAV